MNSKSLVHWIGAHKLLAGVAVIALIGGGYYGYKKWMGPSAAMQYVTQAAEKGTLVVSVSGSGQISALNQVDVKPEASGRIIAIPVSNGMYVSAGQIIGKLDTQDAEKAVRDAAVDVDSARLQLAILKDSSANVEKLVADGYNEVANTFLDLPTVVAGVNDALHDKTIVSYLNLIDVQDRDGIAPLITNAENSYAAARAAYDAAFAHYHSISRTDSQDSIIAFMRVTSDVATKMADAVKNTTNILDYVNDYYTQHGKTLFALYATPLTKHKTDLTNYTSAINPHITSLAATLSSIENAPLSIASQELSVKQRENAFADANNALQNYVIRAPFGGIIASVIPKVGDTASPNTAFATIISSGRYATVSLNEVDVAKIKVRQKATLTFDAIDGSSLTGKVIEIDSIGTVTQGVVTYNVKIALDVADSRVRPGMSVSAAIITDVRQDVVVVPNAAIKTQGGGHYVEIADVAQSNGTAAGTSTELATGALVTKRQPVVIGAANDTMTEVVSGLHEGDVVVVRTVSAAPSGTSQQPTNFRIPGIGGGR